MAVMNSAALAESNKALWDGMNQFWVDEFAKFDLGDAMAWTFAAKQGKMAMVGSDTDFVDAQHIKANGYFGLAPINPPEGMELNETNLMALTEQFKAEHPIDGIRAQTHSQPKRIKPREAMMEYVQPASLVRESALFVVEPGASISYMNKRYHNGSDKPVTLRLDPNGHIELEQIDLGCVAPGTVVEMPEKYLHSEYGLGWAITDEAEIARRTSVGTGQPLTATQVAEMQRLYVKADEERMMSVAQMYLCTHKDGCKCEWCAGQSPSLVDQLKARLRASHDRFDLVEAERNKLMHEKTALKTAVDCFTMSANVYRAERDKLLEDNELKAIAIEALIQANKDLTAQLAELKAGKAETKPNTRDMSRVSQFGGSHKQGLRIHDHY